MTGAQYTDFSQVVKIEKFLSIFFYYFLIFAQNIDCGYTRYNRLAEYPQSMFWSKNKKNRYTPAYPPVLLYKSGVIGGIYYTDMFS